jgi:uncharacterized damage-inducible protein DinB
MQDERASQLSAPELVARLAQSRRSLMDAIAGLDEEGFRLRPREGEWTAAEVLAHILSTERIFIDRAHKAVEQGGCEVIPVSDAVREEHLGMAKRMPVPQIIHGLLAQRRDTLGFVESVSEAGLACIIRHPVRGEQTARWQIEHVIEHEEEHAGQIRVQRAQPAARQA